jgi:hypothetical protein
VLIRAFQRAHPCGRRPTDSRVPTRSPAALAGLTVHPPASRLGVFSARVGDAKTKRPAHLTICWALCSGDVLLSHGLSPYYHRGCSVSLPCSEWERVGPLRYCHQSAEPHWRFRCSRSDASAKPNLWRHRTIGANSPYLKANFKELSTLNSQLIPWHLHTGSKLKIRMTNLETLRLRFCLRSFVSSVCRSAKTRNGLTEK